MSARRLAVVTAGISQPSSSRLLADRLAGVTVDALRERGIDADVTVVEARDLAHDLVDNLLTGFPSPRLRAAIDSVTGADGIVAVSPVFSASYSGLFKTFFDVLEMDALRGTPVALGATGGSERHSLALDHALRPLFAYLGAATVPTGVFAATDDWGDPDAAAGLRVASSAKGVSSRRPWAAMRRSSRATVRGPCRSPGCWPARVARTRDSRAGGRQPVR
ncbi:MAG: NAD(P)H-dependent oxidoreductase [Chloroflexota bacterium]